LVGGDELVAAGVIFPPSNVGGEETVDDLPELPHFTPVRPLGSDSYLRLSREGELPQRRGLADLHFSHF
jgi:hypothetical protein